jgi:rare lipoprotein A
VKRALLLALALAGCVRPAGPPSAPHYVVGEPYQAGGRWYYPKEEFRYDATGLAELVPDRTGLTADGEAFDPAAMAGAHPTLQLPAVARVTNLENGRQVVIRLNDRGPGHPGRILGVTRRAAELLGFPSQGAARVRVEVEDGPSQALRDRLRGGPSGVSAAPRGEVAEESLAPPPGIAASARGRVVATPVVRVAETVAPEAPDRLPETVEQVAPRPGQLWLEAGRFGQISYANQVSARLSGLPVHVEREAGGRSPAFRVIAGPFGSAAEADAALDRAVAAGVGDAEIVVE